MPVAKPKFELNEEYTQLALELELPEVELEGISVEEARLRSEAGRLTLVALKGTKEQPPWFVRWEQLMREGWPWRQATYIAWASAPKDGRKPETQEGLAKEFLNLTSDRAISTWRRKNPAIDTMVAVLQSAELWDSRADDFKTLNEGAARAGVDYKFFKHLELKFLMRGDHVPSTQLAAVIRRKSSGGVKEIAEDTLDELAAGAEEMERNLNQDSIPSFSDPEDDEADDAS